jgi:hypothetical protein
MAELCHCLDTLAGFSRLAEKLVGFGGSAFDFRCIHYQKNTLDLVEEI